MKIADQKKHIKDCLERLNSLRRKMAEADTADFTKIRNEADLIAKEISGLRLLQGYNRLINGLIISIISLISGIFITLIMTRL
jgi:hypothetical protein